MRAVIVGAGIGGLAAAVALRRIGIETVNLERVGEIGEVGAGLSIWSNAVNALRALGVGDKVVARASVVERISSHTLSGRFIGVTDLSEISRAAGAPCVCVHRAVLQRILLEELPAGSVRTGVRCVGFDGSNALLDGGARVEGDLLVGADGIRSAIREGLHGAAEPRYAGYTCWRGISGDSGALKDRSALLAVGSGLQVGVWPCGAGQLYWFLTKNAPARTKQRKNDVAELCRPWGLILKIVEGTAEEAIVQSDIFDRPPLKCWGRGRVTLAGDAAHPTTPNLGQGACQALEDAVVLADCIRRLQPVEAAFGEYEKRRIPRTTMIIRNSWESGRMLQMDRPALEALRNRFMGSRMGKHFSARTFQELLTYRVPKL
jgi:2-polyprenyl-6-methoxyphenol hydroxylase-like FAD-dependent oxidoreductase